MAKVVPKKINKSPYNKNIVISFPNQIKLDEKQLDDFAYQLNNMLDNYSDIIARSNQRLDDHIAFSRTSKLIRLLIFISFLGLGIWLVIGVIQNWNKVITSPFSLPAFLAGILVLIIGIVCFIVAIDIKHESSKNYIISLFSAIVAIVALIVTLIK